MLGDAKIFRRSTFLRNNSGNIWMWGDMENLQFGNVAVSLYLIGDCAFALEEYMMKTSSKPKRRNYPMLILWKSVALQNWKPIECVFRILKNKFEALRFGVRMHYEDDIVRLCYACIIVHIKCIENDNEGPQHLPLGEYELNGTVDEIVTVETMGEKRQRDALMFYLASV